MGIAMQTEGGGIFLLREGLRWSVGMAIWWAWLEQTLSSSFTAASSSSRTAARFRIASASLATLLTPASGGAAFMTETTPDRMMVVG